MNASAKEKAVQRLGNLRKALDRLGELLDMPKDAPAAVEGTIQLFEVSLEVYWRAFKWLLELEGIPTTTPKDALKKAYAVGWIGDEDAWIDMLNARNVTSHTYNEVAALEVYQIIRTNHAALEETWTALAARFPDLVETKT